MKEVVTITLQDETHFECDVDVANLIVALNNVGIETQYSCAGHEKEFYSGFYVSIPVSPIFNSDTKRTEFNKIKAKLIESLNRFNLEMDLMVNVIINDSHSDDYAETDYVVNLNNELNPINNIDIRAVFHQLTHDVFNECYTNPKIFHVVAFNFRLADLITARRIGHSLPAEITPTFDIAKLKAFRDYQIKQLVSEINTNKDLFTKLGEILRLEGTEINSVYSVTPSTVIDN